MIAHFKAVIMSRTKLVESVTRKADELNKSSKYFIYKFHVNVSFKNFFLGFHLKFSLRNFI